MTDPTASTVPSSSTPSSSTTGGVILEAIMEQLQQMQANFGGRLDYLIDEMSYMNNRVGCIACWQACMAGLAPSPSPSPKASLDNDDEDGASSSGDDQMMTFQ